MTFKRLMVHLQLGKSNTGILQIAANLAERHNASISGIALCHPMHLMYGSGYGTGVLIKQDEAEMKKELEVAEAEFRGLLQNRGIKFDWHPMETFFSLSECLAYEARSADLIVMGVNKNGLLLDPLRHIDTGDFLMQAGRPVLIVPEETENCPLERVVVGWKDTRETRRTVLDALPLLKSAIHVTLTELAMEEKLSEARTHLEDVAAWLNLHDIVAKTLALPSTGGDAAQLRAIAKEQRADVIVAGAYGHSRLREWVFGGVTYDLLYHSHCCTFLSH